MSQACFLAVLVARSTDKFPLCSYADPSFQQTRGAAVAKSITSEQMERVLARFPPSSSTQIQSFDFQEFTYYVLPDTTAIVILCVNRHATPFTALFGSGGAADAKVQESACSLLENIQSEFATMYRPELVSSASRPYQFIRFDQQLQKLIRRATLSLSSAASRGGGGGVAAVLQQSRLQQQQQQNNNNGGDNNSLHYRGGAGANSNTNNNDFNNGNNNTNNNGNVPTGRNGAPLDPYAAIKKEVADVHSVMRQNLDDLMTRGERLETMSLYSSELKDSSKTYYSTTKNMNTMRMLKLYGPPVAIVSIILMYLWFFVL